MGEKRAEGGGPELLGRVIEETLGIPTQHFIRIQMTGVVRFIDALGGVDIYLDCPFTESSFNAATGTWNHFNLPKGHNHLDGKQAYMFARMRYRESDIGRSTRQRMLLWALRDRVLSSNAIARLPELYLTFRDSITTDISLLEMARMGRTVLALEPENVRATGLTLKDLATYTTPSGAQVLVVGNRQRVRDKVNNIWQAPPMADAYRKDPVTCPQINGTTADLVPSATGEPALLANPLGSAPFPAFDAITGYPVDPVTGIPIDPATGLPITEDVDAPLLDALPLAEE